MAVIGPLVNVAIVGASGRVGGAFVKALAQTGKHNVTSLARAGGKNAALPEGVRKVEVNYDDEESLVAALKGQQFLAITLSVAAPPDTHSKIVRAAAKAGVPYVMPNTYGVDITNTAITDGEAYTKKNLAQIEEIEKLGVSAHISMVCGFWYEWSLAMGEQCFGFQIKDRKVTFFDDGKTITTISTWNQCGRALAALLSLPESGASPSPSLSDWKSKALYISSFRISQRDMLDSLHRVLGTTDEDWEIKYEPSAKRYQDGKDELARGIMTGFVKSMYARIFFPDGAGDFEKSKGVNNELLGLPKESLDEATKRVVDMVENGWSSLT